MILGQNAWLDRTNVLENPSDPFAGKEPKSERS